MPDEKDRLVSLLRAVLKMERDRIARGGKVKDPLRATPAPHIKVIVWGLNNEEDLQDDLKQALAASQVAQALRKAKVGGTARPKGRGMLLEPVEEKDPKAMEQDEILAELEKARADGWLPPSWNEEEVSPKPRPARIGSIGLAEQPTAERQAEIRDRLREIARRAAERRTQPVTQPGIPQDPDALQQAIRNLGGSRGAEIGHMHAQEQPQVIIPGDYMNGVISTANSMDPNDTSTEWEVLERALEVNPRRVGRTSRAYGSRIREAVESLRDEYCSPGPPPRRTGSNHAMVIFQAFADELGDVDVEAFIDDFRAAYADWVLQGRPRRAR